MKTFLAFSPFASSPLRLVFCALFGPIIALGLLSSLIGHSPSVVGFVVVCAVAALALVPLVPQRVSVGPSSIKLTWLFTSREIAFDRIASFDAQAGGFAPFVLTMVDGARISILPVGWSAAVSRARELCATVPRGVARTPS